MPSMDDANVWFFLRAGGVASLLYVCGEHIDLFGGTIIDTNFVVQAATGLYNEFLALSGLQMDWN